MLDLHKDANVDFDSSLRGLISDTKRLIIV